MRSFTAEEQWSITSKPSWPDGSAGRRLGGIAHPFVTKICAAHLHQGITRELDPQPVRALLWRTFGRPLADWGGQPVGRRACTS